MTELKNVILDNQVKECKTCKELLPFSSFYKDKSKEKLYHECKKCWCAKCKNYRENNPLSDNRKKERSQEWKLWISNNKEERKMSVNEWRKRNPKRYKDSFLKRKYSITTDMYNEILNSQNNSCAICKIHESNLNYPMFIDHCHSTGRFRGLLCRNCNSGIGYFKDNISVIENSISYLEKFKEHVNS